MKDAPAEPSRRRSLVQYTARVSAGIGAIGLLLHWYDFREIRDVALGADVLLLVAGFAVGCLGMALRALWQQAAFSPVRRMSVAYLLTLQFQQSFYSLFMPGDSANLIRWYRIMQPVGKPGVTLAIMWFNQLLLGAIAIVISATGVALDQRYPLGNLRLLYPAAVAVGAASIGSFVVANRRSGVASWLPASRLLWIRERARDYTAAVRATGALGGVRFLGLMGLGYTAGIAETYFAASAVGIDLSLPTFLWLLPAITFLAEVPVSISGAGVRDLSMVFLFGLYGVEAQSAVACGVLCFALLVARGVVGGVLEFVIPPASSPEDPPSSAGATARQGRVEAKA